MNSNHVDVPQTPSVGLDDLFYLFFRHKWKIIFFTLCGIAAGAAFYLTSETEYRAQAKLLVRYITDKKDIRLTSPHDPDSVRSLDPREGAIMLAEAEILRSADCITAAVQFVGPQLVLKAYDSGTNLFDAVDLVQKNLQVENTRSSGLMIVTLSHRDQEIALRLLSRILKEYESQHQKTHDSPATLDQVVMKSTEVKNSLMAIDNDLKAQKKKVNIWSLNQTKVDLSTQLTDLRTKIVAAESELAEAHAFVDERKSTSSRETNEVTAANGKTARPEPSSADIAHFNQLARKLAGLKNYEDELLQTFSESSKKVQKVRADIKVLQEEIEKLPIDAEFLARVGATANGQPAPTFDFGTARAKIASIEARYQYLTNSYAQVREQGDRVDAAEDTIVKLEQQKQEKEGELAFLQKAIEEMKLNQATQGDSIKGSLGNIVIIQTATRISPDAKKIMKKAGAAVGVGVGVGFLLSLLLDYVFNPTVKRSKDLEAGLKVPVLASIPDFGRKLRKAKKTTKKGVALEKNGQAFTNGEIAPWEESDPMLPYYEALRDRVVMSYNGDLHKPKIVGLTSCHAGAGVTRLATGLAASLSRDAERNVLLVGLERNKVAVSAFAKGRPAGGIQPPVEGTNSDQEHVAQNLYSLATTGRNLAGASVVQSFSDLLPKLKISDYDYIIFDLPPLTQTSGSLRLASQMERAILVVEAEETAKSNAKRVTTLLKASQPKLFSVLNKAHSFGPKALREDI